MMRLNTEGQLTSGEWCNDKDGSGTTLTVQWCQMGKQSKLNFFIVPIQYQPYIFKKNGVSFSF